MCAFEMWMRNSRKKMFPFSECEKSQSSYKRRKKSHRRLLSTRSFHPNSRKWTKEGLFVCVDVFENFLPYFSDHCWVRVLFWSVHPTLLSPVTFGGVAPASLLAHLAAFSVTSTSHNNTTTTDLEQCIQANTYAFRYLKAQWNLVITIGLVQH